MNDIGRPTVMTLEVLAKLEEAFSVGATDKEAIFIAGISKDAFYDYCKINPDFADRKEALKDMPKYAAKKNIVNKINLGDVSTSQWYAERKIKEEFSNRTDLNLSGELISKIISVDE